MKKLTIPYGYMNLKGMFVMENITKEKSCAFYASDYHFEMISLPYISKGMDENKEIVILTENDLKDTVNTLISKMNLQKEKREKILSLDWNNNDLKKFPMLSCFL